MTAVTAHGQALGDSGPPSTTPLAQIWPISKRPWPHSGSPRRADSALGLERTRSSRDALSAVPRPRTRSHVAAQTARERTAAPGRRPTQAEAALKRPVRRQRGSGDGCLDSDRRGLVGGDCERGMRERRSRRGIRPCLGGGRASASSLGAVEIRPTRINPVPPSMLMLRLPMRASRRRRSAR
jgi:hypothetical protein